MTRYGILIIWTFPARKGQKSNLYFYAAKERKVGTAVHFSLLPFFAVHFLQFLFCKVPCAACGRYTDPESQRFRNYYPDFLVEMRDGSYQIIEIKGDNKLNDQGVQAKKRAALVLASGSNMIYRMIPGSSANNPLIVDPNFDKKMEYPSPVDGYGMRIAADSGDIQQTPSTE
jgi:hypothetical protein